MLSKGDCDALLATVAMDMFVTGNTVDEEIEHYDLLAEVGHAEEDFAGTIQAYRSLLDYLMDHPEAFFDKIIEAINEAERKLG